MKFYSAYKRRDSAETALHFHAPSLTKQEFRDECDVNVIMRRYAAGQAPQAWTNPPQAHWGDFATAPDFLEAQLLVLHAREQFEQLPATIRDRFQNDPARLLAFVHDKANLDEARKLGLANPAPPAPTPPPAPAGT